MLKKLLAAMFAATLMAGTALGVDIRDLGTATGGALHTGSVGIASPNATVNVAAGGNELQIGSSTGGSFTLGALSNTGVNDILIGANTNVPANFATGKVFSLTATSVNTANALGVYYDEATPYGVSSLTVKNGITAGTTFDVSGATVALTGGRMNITGKATYTNATVTVKGGAAALGSTYGGLDLAGSSYTDGGDVALTQNSTWDDNGAPDFVSSSVNVAGTVTLTDGKTLDIKGGSDATLGGFKWSGIATGGAYVAVDEGSSLVVNGDVAIATNNQSLKIGAADDATTGQSSVDIKGELKFTKAGTTGLQGLSANDPSILKAGSLVVGDTGLDITAIDASKLDVTVTGLTTINNNSSLKVDGEKDVYEGGILVTGPNATTGTLIGNTAADTVISTGSNFVTLKDGGKIATSAAGATSFTINGGGVKIENDGTGAKKAVIDAGTAAAGIVIEKDLNVAGNLDLTTAVSADSMITAGTYTQTTGTVTQTGAGQLTVQGAASIAGNKSVFNLIATGGTNDVTTFEGGLTLDDSAKFVAAAANSQFTINDGQALTLGDKALLDASTNALTLVSSTPGTGTNTIKVTGNGNEIRATNAFTAADSNLVIDAQYQNESSLKINGVGAAFGDVLVKSGELGVYGSTVNTGKNVVVENGAYIATAGGANFTGNGVDSQFIAKAGSNIEANNGSYNIDATFAKASLDGNILVGKTGAVVNNIASNAGETVLGDNANVIFSTEAANAIVADADLANNPYVLVQTPDGQLSVSQGAKIQDNGLGQFGFEFGNNGTNDFFYLASKANVISGDGSATDRGQFMMNSKYAWSRYGIGEEIDYTLASAAYDAVVPSVSGAPMGLVDNTTTFGTSTIRLLQALGTTNRAEYSQGVGKSIFRNGDVSEMLQAGIGEIRGIQSAIGVRNVQLRSQLVGAGDVYYEYANPTLLLNNDYANRIWAGYLGQWEKGDKRNGVDGYDYDSHGFIVGYDRLVGCNFAFGGAFAYTRGDYEDKTADSNSSKVDNYSFNGYATYSASNGFFANLFGGYTHQKNDISARYRNTSKSAGYNSDFWNIGTQLGYDFQPMDNLVITPSIGLTYIHGKSKSHTSTWFNATNGFGAGFVDSATQKAFLLPIEIAAKYNIEFSNCSRLTLEGNVGYAYNFEKDGGKASMSLANVQVGGAPVFINGYDRDAGRHTFNAGAGVRYTFNRFDVGVKYDYYLQQDAHAHRVLGSVGVSF